MKACCVSFDVSRTKLETFPVLGWKSQLIISKGKVHGHISASLTKMASRRCWRLDVSWCLWPLKECRRKSETSKRDLEEARPRSILGHT